MLTLLQRPAQLGRLAILKPYRSYGFGRVLVESVHDWARKQLKEEQDKLQIGLHAQVCFAFILELSAIIG